ncbi:hypothetical protein RFI_02476 [Reticulomyxa filosa]|uniref:Uncharacterized protein n=1 Tax=Reticulomyxa filosa TaxID=46433 RepID=X6P7W2_RETFI|nr:hypothetical protein RFI_02476 [Reticulomyxa filosa]|eukprot:ETO34615.1 hypothetical protein RFI_02476 [Reticulomyxa filosa]
MCPSFCSLPKRVFGELPTIHINNNKCISTHSMDTSFIVTLSQITPSKKEGGVGKTLYNFIFRFRIMQIITNFDISFEEKTIKYCYLSISFSIFSIFFLQNEKREISKMHNITKTDYKHIESKNCSNSKKGPNVYNNNFVSMRTLNYQ